MIEKDTQVLVQHYLDQGLSKTAVARLCGISRQTVYRWIKDGTLDPEGREEPVRRAPAPSRPSKLDSLQGDH